MKFLKKNIWKEIKKEDWLNLTRSKKILIEFFPFIKDVSKSGLKKIIPKFEKKFDPFWLKKIPKM